jgi:hypothetical protein
MDLSSSSFEQSVEAGRPASKADTKRFRRGEPLRIVYIGLILFMVAYFARPEDWTPGLAAVPFAKITGVMIVLALLFSFNTIHWHMPQEVLFLALLILQLWLTVPFSTVWKTGAFYMMLYFSKILPLVIVMYAAVRSMKRLRGILVVQGASIASVAIASIFVSKADGRLQGIAVAYGNSNDLALVIVLSLPLCLALALTSGSIWKKLGWTVAMFLMVYASILTASRGGAIALTVVTLICLWHLAIKGRRFYLLMLVPVAVMIAWLYGGSSLRTRFEQINTAPATDTRGSEASASAQQRKELLLQSLRVTAQHPLFGVGPGNFPIVSGVWRASHNSYTQMSSEGGIPALVLYLLIFWRSITNLREVRQCRKASKQIRLFSMALSASLAGYFVGSFFTSVAYQLFPYCFVVYIGILRLIAKREQAFSIRAASPQPNSTEVGELIWE